MEMVRRIDDMAGGLVRQGNRTAFGPVNLKSTTAMKEAAMKRIEKDGKFYRMRRGKLVEIPAEWVGEVVHAKTMRERRSNLVGKVARQGKYAFNRNHKDRSVEISTELAAEELKRK
jgi:hypothetical protein